MNVLKKLPIHPFLFGIYPILLLLSVNLGEAGWRDAVGSSIVVLTLVGIMFLLLELRIKNIYESSLITSLFVCLTFSYGPLREFMERIINNNITLDIIVVTFAILVFFIGLWLIRETNLNLRVLFTLSTVFSSSLVLSSLISIGFYYNSFPAGGNIEFFRNQVFGEDDILKKELPTTPNRGISSKDPNIYFFIFDRYANDEVLEKSYGFDNKDFSHFLKANGFHVFKNAYSNYSKTILSLASTFNMNYLNKFSDTKWAKNGSTYPLVQVIQENRVFQFLKNRGYKIWHYGSWWEPTKKMKNADQNINYSLFNEFSMALFKTTIFSALSRDLISSYEQWIRVEKQFKSLRESLAQKTPTFFLVHMTVPHPPAVFFQDGKFKNPLKRQSFSEEQNYIEQVKYVNAEMRKFISTALSAESHPIIILQADEGPRPKRFFEKGSPLSWNNATALEVRKKLGIINAFYLPDEPKEFFPSNIAPVNTFRILFNLYFETKLPILEEKYYTEEYSNGSSLKFLDASKKLYD